MQIIPATTILEYDSRYFTNFAKSDLSFWVFSEINYCARLTISGKIKPKSRDCGSRSYSLFPDEKMRVLAKL